MEHGGVLVAVLALLVAGIPASEPGSASINSKGILIHAATRGSQKINIPAELVDEHEDDRGARTSSGSLNSSSFLTTNLLRREEQHKKFRPHKPEDWLSIFRGEGDQPTAPPNEYLMFSWDAGGSWDGSRNDLDAEVGFEFEVLQDFNLTAIGRHAAGHWSQMYDNGTGPGINLFEPTNVTLWYVMPKGMKLRQGLKKEGWAPLGLKLLSIEVGPNSTQEVGGKYNFIYLDEPFVMHAHEKYRITQSCWPGMQDVWFDGVADKTDINMYMLTECTKLGHGVHSKHRHKYPDMIEHIGRRAGMLNIRIVSKKGCGVAVPINSKEAAETAASEGVS